LTNEELREFLNRIASTYPNFVKRDSNKADILKAWSEALADVTPDGANGALDRHIKTSAYIPTPADILKLVDVHDKWGLISDAIEINKRTYKAVTGKEWPA